jgi:hypothetical protein
MPRNATPTILVAPPELSPSQITALAALLAGSAITVAAEQAAVSRETVHRWLREPVFAAAYNRQRRDLWEATETRLLRLADRATTVVERALDQDGDVKAALALLKGLGLLAGSTPARGPDTPESVEDEQIKERIAVGDRALNRRLAGLGAGD